MIDLDLSMIHQWISEIGKSTTKELTIGKSTVCKSIVNILTNDWFINDLFGFVDGLFTQQLICQQVIHQWFVNDSPLVYMLTVDLPIINFSVFDLSTADMKTGYWPVFD